MLFYPDFSKNKERKVLTLLVFKKKNNNNFIDKLNSIIYDNF